AVVGHGKFPKVIDNGGDAVESVIHVIHPVDVAVDFPAGQAHQFVAGVGDGVSFQRAIDFGQLACAGTSRRMVGKGGDARAVLHFGEAGVAAVPREAHTGSLDHRVLVVNAQ